MPKSVILLGLLILTVAAPAALQSADSDDSEIFWIILLGTPIITIVGFIAASRVIRAIRSHTMKLRALGIYCVCVALAFSAIYGGVWRWLHPANIHYKFKYGWSGSWQEVQFTHTEHGQEVKGPWVGAWPVRVRFPDLNHDGHPDIRVIGNGDNIAEYVYLPQNDGKHFWHLVRKEGFAASYPPDGQFYP